MFRMGLRERFVDVDDQTQGWQEFRLIKHRKGEKA